MVITGECAIPHCPLAQHVLGCAACPPYPSCLTEPQSCQSLRRASFEHDWFSSRTRIQTAAIAGHLGDDARLRVEDASRRSTKSAPREVNHLSTAEAFHLIEEVAAMHVPLLALTAHRGGGHSLPAEGGQRRQGIGIHQLSRRGLPQSVSSTFRRGCHSAVAWRGLP